MHRRAMDSCVFAAAALILLTAACETEGARSFAQSTAALASGGVTVALSGAGSASGAPLSALVEIDVLDASSARILVTNTAPATSSTVPGAPILTRVGFNLADGPDAACLSLATPDGRFAMARRVQPFCGRTPKLGAMFAYGFDAENPAPATGIERDEALAFVLSVDPACGYALTPSSFTDAPSSPSGGVLTQWVAKFQVVGEGGEDSGCAGGDTSEAPEPEYIWSEFIATGAEVTPLPSVFRADDTRAGSVELNYNGGYGFNDLIGDAPFTAATANLRNGAGVILEQWQVNRFYAPHNLDADGCSTTTAIPQCWAWGEGGPVTVALPTHVADSNEGFDPGSADRVTVRAETTVDDGGAPTDNSAQWFTITWEDPSGLDADRMNLRLHFDANLNRTLGDDPIYSLFRVRFPGDGPDFVSPVVNVVAVTATSVTVEVNVQDAIDYVWDLYLGLPGYLP